LQWNIISYFGATDLLPKLSTRNIKTIYASEFGNMAYTANGKGEIRVTVPSGFGDQFSNDIGKLFSSSAQPPKRSPKTKFDYIIRAPELFSYKASSHIHLRLRSLSQSLEDMKFEFESNASRKAPRAFRETRALQEIVLRLLLESRRASKQLRRSRVASGRKR
jgi:hypothetical protein